MFFLNDLDSSDVEFKRGRKKGSKNKLRRYDDVQENISSGRKVVSAATSTSKELREWLKLIRSFQ